MSAAPIKRGETPTETRAIHAKLTFLSGPRSGDECNIDTLEVTLGRSREAHVRIKDEAISRLHAKIVRGADGYQVVDLKSRHGTKLNGASVDSGHLSTFDVIELGESRIRFTILVAEDTIISKSISKSEPPTSSGITQQTAPATAPSPKSPLWKRGVTQSLFRLSVVLAVSYGGYTIFLRPRPESPGERKIMLKKSTVPSSSNLSSRTARRRSKLSKARSEGQSSPSLSDLEISKRNDAREEPRDPSGGDLASTSVSDSTSTAVSAQEKAIDDKQVEQEKRQLVQELLKVATASLKAKRYQEAIDSAEKARRVELSGDTEYLNRAKQIIDNSRILQKDEFEPFLMEAREKFLARDYVASRDLLEEMLRRDPGYEDAKELLAMAREKLNDLAKQAFDRGVAAESMNQSDEAKRFFEQAEGYARPGDEYYDRAQKKLRKGSP